MKLEVKDHEEYTEEDIEVMKEKSTRKAWKRNPWLEEKILLLLSHGVPKTQAIISCDLNPSTFYRWMKDPVFARKVRQSMGGSTILKAHFNMCNAAEDGDLDASKYILNKTKFYEKRYDNPDLPLMGENVTTGVIDVVHPNDVDQQLLGHEFVADDESELDEVEQMLYAQDPDIK